MYIKIIPERTIDEISKDADTSFLMILNLIEKLDIPPDQAAKQLKIKLFSKASHLEVDKANQ